MGWLHYCRVGTGNIEEGLSIAKPKTQAPKSKQLVLHQCKQEKYGPANVPLEAAHKWDPNDPLCLAVHPQWLAMALLFHIPYVTQSRAMFNADNRRHSSPLVAPTNKNRLKTSTIFGSNKFALLFLRREKHTRSKSFKSCSNTCCAGWLITEFSDHEWEKPHPALFGGPEPLRYAGPGYLVLSLLFEE